MQAASFPATAAKNAFQQNAMIALADGSCFAGIGFGKCGIAVGELVFNTAMTGYQEILSDPSYANQLVTFTFPQIGITGVNEEDIEATQSAAKGLVVRCIDHHFSNWRSVGSLSNWCEKAGLVGISGVDTRQITNILRDKGAQNAAISFDIEGPIDAKKLIAEACAFDGLEGQDLVPGVTCKTPETWNEADWHWAHGYRTSYSTGPHIVVVDYGIKHNILRMLAELNCRVSIVSAKTTSDAILALDPDAIVLSNGPGDPAATGKYAALQIQKLVESGKPLMGICLGHQMLGLALGAKTNKMRFGHHGANHPVMDIKTGRVEITSQNHGFAISEDNMPETLEITHRSLFDGTVQGIALRDRPVYSVQYHPEASPGPTDSRYLFKRLLESIQKA